MVFSIRWPSRICSALLFALAQAAVLAGPYDPPASYYNSATGSGNLLKSQLHSIIDNHAIYSYNDARTVLQETDRDLNDADRMILAYDRISLDVSVINPNGSIPGWDNAATWNREHTWPRSRGVNSSGPDNSDLHQLRPTTTQVNSDRGNLNFGGVFGAQSFGAVIDNGNLVWYPGDADGGMVARQQFYMAVRYDGSDSSTENVELVAGAPNIGGTTMGDLDRLIEWHYEAVPDDFELRRNDVIYDNYQGNRNPFIDRPEYVWSVFVDQQNDSQIAIAGAAVAADGATSSTVDLGRVLVGASVPSAHSVSLNKNGNDGTYFDVSTTGAATSSTGGRFNAFSTGGADGASLNVGLNASTATAGLRSGTVTIDNLDVTASGGAGRGANDGDDVISVTLDVLDHANASFASMSDLNSLTHDFGVVTEGDLFPTFEFDVFNLVDTAGFTANLELDALTGSGDTSVLTTDLSPFVGASALAEGMSNSFTAALDTSAVGTFSAVYTLSFSDDDLPGAISVDPLTLTLLGSVESAAIDADFDDDGDVDGADFLAIQRTDSAAILDWEQQFGNGAPVTIANSAVPEPTSAMLLGLALAMVAANGRRKIRNTFQRDSRRIRRRRD